MGLRQPPARMREGLGHVPADRGSRPRCGRARAGCATSGIIGAAARASWCSHGRARRGPRRAAPISITRPLFITTTCCAMLATTPRSWVTRITAMPVSSLQFVDQPQHLSLGGDIERRGRLIRDQQLGLGDHGHGDHRALAHAARHLEGIAFPGAFGVDKADPVELFEHPPPWPHHCGHVAVQAQHFADLIAEPVQRRQRTHRFLEDHRNAIAPDGCASCVRAAISAGPPLAVPCHETPGCRCATARFPAGCAAPSGRSGSCPIRFPRPAPVSGPPRWKS